MAASVAVIGGAYTLWETVLEYRFVPKRWGVVVIDQVYRSGQLHPALVKRTLDKNGIDVVVSLIDPDGETEWGKAADRAEADACRELGIERHVYPLRGDGTGEIENYAKTIATVVGAMEQGDRVLVHCAAGAQRAGGTIAAFRVLVQGWDPRRASVEMTEYRWEPHKDMAVLDYLNEHMDVLIDLLIELDVLDKAPETMPVMVAP